MKGIAFILMALVCVGAILTLSNELRQTQALGQDRPEEIAMREKTQAFKSHMNHVETGAESSYPQAQVQRHVNISKVTSVNFDNKSELDRLRAIDQELYFKLMSIIEEVRYIPPEAKVSEWLRVKHGATSYSIGSELWKTAYPPKTNLSFHLDGVWFSGTVSLMGFPANFLYKNR